MNQLFHTLCPSLARKACATLYAVWLAALVACQVTNPAYNISGRDADDVDLADAPIVEQEDARPPGFDAEIPPADVFVSPDVMQDAGAVSLMLQGCDPADPDLLLCLRFEDNLADQSGKPHTVQGLAQFVDGANGRALDLGASELLASGDSAAFVVSRFTVEAWLRGAVASTQGPALLFQATDIVSLWVEPSGLVVCQLGGAMGSKVSATPSPAGLTWKSLACTYDGTELAIFANGFVAGSRNVGAWTPSTSAAHVYMVERLGFSAWQSGHLDNVRFWRRRLSPRQLWLP